MFYTSPINQSNIQYKNEVTVLLITQHLGKQMHNLTVIDIQIHYYLSKPRL